MHDRTSAASPLPPAPRPAETPAQEKMGVWAVRGSLCVCLMVLPYISYPTASPWSLPGSEAYQSEDGTPQQRLVRLWENLLAYELVIS